MAIFAELIVESRVVVVVVAVVVARMRWMVHITLNGYTGAAERRPRRDARPLHTGTTLFRSVPLSRFTLSPPLLPPTSHRLPLLLSLSPTVFPPSVSSVHRRDLSLLLFRSSSILRLGHR